MQFLHAEICTKIKKINQVYIFLVCVKFYNIFKKKVFFTNDTKCRNVGKFD